jgi:hypothetical protein
MAPYAYSHSPSTAAYEGFQTPVICWDGMWNPFFGRTTIIFDVQISDMDAKSYGNHTSKKVLESTVLRKKSKYDEACLERRLDFTPMLYSVDSMADKYARAAEKRIAGILAAK